VKTAVIVLGSALTAGAALPYIIDIVRGRARPRIASWGIWTVVQAIGAASGFSEWQLPAACYTLLCAAGCAAVVFLGWRHGSREFGRLDAVCVTLAAEGVALLAVAAWVPRLIPMSWAVAVSVATDFLAYLPTFRHAWLRPDEEPWIPYAMFGVAAGLVLVVADFRVLAGVIYPTYLFAADAAMVIMILGSPHYQAARPTDRARAFGLPAGGFGGVVLPQGGFGGMGPPGREGASRAPMRLSAASAQWRPVTGRDWRQPDLGPAVQKQRGPDYDAPQPWPGHGPPQPWPGHGPPQPWPGQGPPQPWPGYGPPQGARDHGRPLRVRDHGRPFRTAEPTSW
jgi:hypothetical protein